jgi:hypothetical protein
MLALFVVAVLAAALVLAAVAPEIRRDLAMWAAITTLTATAVLTWGLT